MELSWNDAFLVAIIASLILASYSLIRLNYPSAKKPKPIVVMIASIEELENNKHGKLYASLQVACPECGGPPRYVCGPSGGMSQNIFCSSCGQGYNVCEFINFAEPIHKDPRYIEKEKEDGHPSMGR